MDYQTFAQIPLQNSQHLHAQPQSQGPFSASLPGASAPPSHAQPALSHQQQQQQQQQRAALYQDPHSRFQQTPSSQSFQFSNGSNGQAGGFPLASSMGGGSIVASSGALMQPANLSQHQLHHARVQQSSSPYSSAPYSQPISSPAVSAAQQLGQFHKTTSPSNNHISPYGIPQHQQNSQQPEPSQQHPMAAPPTTQSQALQSMSQSSMKAVPQSPVSPDAQIRDQGRDRERVAVLLDINSELLQEIVSLQAQGKAGHIGQMPPPKEEGKPEPDLKPASKEYVDCMRRLQANLSYLATTAERAHKPSQVIPPGPAIMSVPSSYPALSDLYTKLQALFPGWRGQQLKASPGPQRPNMQQMQQNPQAQPSQG